MEEKTTADGNKDRHHKWVSTSKDVIASIRELILITIVALLLLWPKLINGRLQEAGFTQADVMGLHWEKEIQAAAAKTGEAQQRVEVIQERIDSVAETLQQISKNSDDPAVKTATAGLKMVLDSSLQNIAVAQRDLKNGMRIQEKMLLQAPQTPFAAATEESQQWGIVVSSDRVLGEARFELERARKLGFTSVALYEQGKWYRTVISFPDRESTQHALQEVRSALRETAFVVDLNDWCTDPQKDAGKDIYICGAH